MGINKTPSKPSASTSLGKQRTISSFFTAPKSAPKSAPATKKTNPLGDQGNLGSFASSTDYRVEKEVVKPPSAPRSAKARQTPQKRVLEDAESDDEELYTVPKPKQKDGAPAKRARRNPNRVLESESESEAEVESELQQEHEGRDETFLEVPSTSPAKGGKLKQALSERTARYRFSSGQEAMQVDDDPSNVTTKKWKEKMHEKFVKKLGKPDFMSDIRRKNGIIDEQDENAEEAEGEEPEEEEEEPGPIAKRFGKGVKAQKAAAPKGKGKGRSKLTPLEQQVVDIKRKYPDTVLVVEVGYKFRFFGEDARVASQNLSIMCIPGKMRFDEHPSEAHLEKFASASIPVPRLHVHVKRLVSAGYKVGIVRQRETAALKAAGENRNAPFVRELTNLYTKGTYIDDIDTMGDVAAGSGSGGAPNTGYLLCITEKPGGGTGTDEKSHVGIVAVQPATGDVIYDEFDDGFMRSEIETRLLHIAPCEFLIVGELTKATEKMVSHLAGNTTTVFGERVRVERVDRKKGGSTTMASKHILTFYADKLKSADSANAAEANKLLDSVMNLSDLVTVCLSAMITHLSDYGLEHVFDLTKYFTPFNARSHMLLNGNTLSSLEIYRNQTDYTTKGSLFWTLDRTKTKFGKRLLRKWVGRPLLHKETLEDRIEAVEEILAGKNGKLDRIRELLSRIGSDLEKGLIRIYYGKCTRPELFQILQAMHRISNTFHKVDTSEEVRFQSRVLNEAVAALPEIKESVETYLDVFRHNSACKDDKYDFFKNEDQYEAITEHKMGIAAVEADLQGHLKEIGKILKRPRTTYVSVSGIEFLTEVSNDKNSLKLVPASWVKISGTKKVSRFHTPKVIKLIRERDQHKEALSAECDKAFREFLSEISTKYQEFRDCVQSLSTLDCLFSLAVVASQPNYCKPEFTAEMCIEVTEGRHPMVEQLLIDAYVPNDIALYAASKRAMVVTGPNMGGKSSYVRQVALISIMAQIGSYVPAISARVGLLDAVFTRMGAFDNMMAGESTFMVELSETSDILKMATGRSLVILDELGRGTSTHDGVAIAHAVLDYVVKEIGCMCLFVTHYPLLAQFGEKYKGEVTNAHMRFSEANDGSEDITFLYQIGEGVAHRSYGLNVARLAGIPKRCLDTAGVKSAQLETELKEKETIRWANTLNLAMTGSDLFDPTMLLKSLEYI